MVASRKDENPMAKRPPATTPLGRENQMIALTMDLVERKLLAGTATSQETVHFLKLATERERLERIKLEQETKLAGARVNNLESADRLEKLMGTALDAFRGYQPSGDDEIID